MAFCFQQKRRVFLQESNVIRAGLYENIIKGILTRAEYLEMQEDYNQKISGAVERAQ